MRDRLAVGLVTAAELGHLTAAWVEADAWPLISGFHIVVACWWGFVLAGLRTAPLRAVTVWCAVVPAMTLPASYLVTRTLGLPTYVTFTRLPTEPVGVVVSLIEVVLAAALLAGRRGRDRARARRPGSRLAGPA